MKSRPILFSAPMVTAILDGTKTQTRRTWKPRPGKFDDQPHLERCPYGQPGDQFWVKETYRTDQILDNISPKHIEEGQPIKYECDDEATSIVPFGWGRIRQSIFMRKWMSRITLQITNIRVERLQDISPDDCRAEGMPHGNNDIGVRYGYGQLWNQINGPGSWDQNPYVWVVEFKRIQP